MINSSLICLTFAAMLSRIGLYIRYWIHSKGPNRVHSPFVFNLYTNIILSDKHFYAFQAIEKIREQLLKSEQIISSRTASNELIQQFIEIVENFINISNY
jgi:hypothetical protein